MKYLLTLVCLLLAAALIYLTLVRGRKDNARKIGEMNAQMDALQDKVKVLSRELEESRRTRLGVVDINPVLHVAVMNIDSSFTRTYVRERDGMTFNGALRAEITAEYGIKLEEARFRLDSEAGVLEVANFRPGLISYSRKQLTWDIARSFRTRHLFGHELSAISDSATDSWTKKVCEELRTSLEKEIDERRISEFDWLSPLVSAQVTDFLRLLVGRSDLSIKIADSPAGTIPEGFVSLPELFQGGED